MAATCSIKFIIIIIIINNGTFTDYSDLMYRMSAKLINMKYSTAIVSESFTDDNIIHLIAWLNLPHNIDKGLASISSAINKMQPIRGKSGEKFNVFVS